MANLKIDDFKVFLPSDFKGDFTEAHVSEWLECQLGVWFRHDIEDNNPLRDIELADCIVSIGKATLDGKEIKIDEII